VTTRDIVFIHGMFMNPRSWADWVTRFTAKGYTCHTVAWPGHDGEPSELRRAPPEVLKKLKLSDVLQTHRDFLDTLGAKPLLVGHSVGGLITQKLVNEGRAAAAVALDPAPPQGIFAPSWTFLKTNLPVVNPFAGDAPFQFTVEQFQYAFCNTMTLDETRAVFERFVVPESRNVARSVAGSDAKIDFKKPHAPLLILGGELDNIVPSALNEKNFKAYTDPASKREFKLLPGRTHYLCGQKGWEETADLVHDWLRPY
jgi:pimeloyl-ACP methyl ester carboxylesterase